MHLRILYSSTREKADLRPSVEPWHEPIHHRFDETHARWVPIVPLPVRVASDENVVATATPRGINRFTLPSLTEMGHLSLQPSTSGSAEPAAAAAETVAMITDSPSESLPPLPESPILADDVIPVDDNHTTPTAAEMVE